METNAIRRSLSVLLKFSFLVGVSGLMFSNSACQSHPCREPRAPELDQTGPAKVAAATPPVKNNDAGAKNSGETANLPQRLRVYKSDGSRQCDKRGGVSLEVMERELAGIPVYGKAKRSDGLMHIQVCGSPTGMINLFEIDLTNLKQAEERGFRRWEGE